MLGESAGTHGILFVCTGNICRSPYAERRLRQLLPALDVPITSAGTGAVVGADIEPETSEVLAALGADITGFRARELTPHLLAESELVLTMTRAHRGEAARLDPRAMRRIFALGDFADLCRASHSWLPITPTSPWLPQVVAEAAAARGTVAPRDTVDVDVDDPYGRSARTHADACERIERHLAALVDTLGPAAAGPSRSPMAG